jgi:hypothetical protein
MGRKIISIRQFVIIISILFQLLALFYVNSYAQTVNPDPNVTIYISSDKAPIYQDFKISWKCIDPSASMPEYQLQTRYKIDIPGEWIGGIKYNINKWTEFKDGQDDHLIYSDFIIEGQYKISVQCRNKITGKTSKIISKTFNLFWEYPEIQEEAFIINWDKVNRAKTEKERYQILAEEYNKSYNLWNQKFEYETRLMKSTISKEEIIQLTVGSIGETMTEEALISLLKAPAKSIVKKILFPKQIYDIIKMGTIDIIIIYRAYHAVIPYHMTVVS